MSFGHERLDVYRRGYTVREEAVEDGTVGIDPDADSDSDPETERGLTSCC